MYIWAIGLFAAGQSSTMTGTYAGQFVMEGFLDLKWARWKRVLLTRTIAILPTFFIAFYKDLNDLTGMNDVLNALQAIQLPFAIFPLFAFGSSEYVMGQFKNGWFNKILAVILSVILMGINMSTVVGFVNGIGNNWYVWLLAGLFFVYYIVFVAYLVSIKLYTYLFIY